jgi:ribonuclease HI
MENITARFDGSFRQGEENIIGIGYTINEDCFKDKWIAADDSGSQAAELLALISLLETIVERDYTNCRINIEGDSKSVISKIRRNSLMCNHEIQCEYIFLLLETIKEKNQIYLKWIPRENNTTCNALAKNKLTFLFPYKTSNGQKRKFHSTAFFMEDAINMFYEFVNKNNMTPLEAGV